MKLTPKQEKFANLYVELGNASEAYRQAYDVTTDNLNTINVKASKLLKQHREYINALRNGKNIEFKPTPKPTKGYVYLMMLEGFDFYKVGISQNVPSRLKSLKTLMPFDVKLIKFIHVEDYKKVEKQIHNSLERYRHRGEWFKGCLGAILKEFNKYDN